MYSIMACKFENVIFKAVQHNCHTKATYFVKAKISWHWRLIDPPTIHSKKTKVNSKIINLVIPCLWPPKSNVVKVMPPIDNSCDAADSTKIRKIQVYCVHTLPLI